MVDTDRVAAHALAALAAVAGSFAVGGTTLAFVVTPAYDVVARSTPGVLVGVVVTQAPGLTDAVAYAVALALTVAALTLLVALTVELSVRLATPTLAVFGTAVLTTAVVAVATGYLFRALAAGIPAAVVVLYFLADPRPPTVALSPARRRVLRAAGGETWRDARLSDPLDGALDGDVWRQWAYTWESPPEGDHEVRARAVTEDGTVQPPRETGPFPSGASGWAETTLTV